MISRNLYLNIVFRVLMIVIISVLLGYLAAGGQSVRFILICFLTLIFITINLISYLNTTNRNIRFFFDSVKNDDSSLSFPTDSNNSTFRELNSSMNRVNQQIKNLKIENRNQEQYFQILMEHIPAGIISFNEKGFILHANSSAKRLFSVDVLTHLQQIEQIDHKLYQTIKTIKPSERRLIALSTMQGEIQLSLKAAAFITKEAELIILSIEDIKNELDEKELESWMKLIRVLTHEIMNSVTPITSLSESLSVIYCRDGKPVQPEDITAKTISTTLQGLNVIKEQGRGLQSFVESYRKLTRLPEPERKRFRVSELISRVAVLYNTPDNSNKTELRVEIKSDSELCADQNLISQVLINLVKNALEANENNPDTQITILTDVDSNLHPLICVTDNGPGISEESIDKIFIPFYTTRQRGSGIGLSISRQIMRAHGGNLKVRSVPGRETVFCMSF
ncbi:MAG: ATP-binding protein [Bacteroidales bacterium]|nr:ATP-binding protein [Bacteroidales bacterium]MBK8883210.1 ATP-binding protein [Bacteroidales bacterium]